MTLRLLIAEDEDMIRNGIEKYIRLHTDRFAQIYTAQNGQEALDIIFQSRPDIMLLDVQMPLKDGIEVMKEAKGRIFCRRRLYSADSRNSGMRSRR